MPNFKNAKLTNLIKKLSPDDIKKLSRFLDARYLNSNKKLPDFFAAICKYYPSFEHKKFTSENIYKKAYPKEDFSIHKFRKLKEDLTNRIFYYLAIEELRAAPHFKEKLTIKGLARIEHYNSFRIKAEARIKEMNKKGHAMNLQDLLNLQQTNHDLFFHPQTIQGSDLAEGYINASMDYLDCFYFFSKITYGLQLLSRGKVLKRKYKIRLLDQAINLGKQTALKDNCVFNLYVLVIQLLKSEKEDHFVTLKDFFFGNTQKITKEGKIIGSVILTNFAVSQERNGNANYQKEIFNLYKFRETENLFLQEGSISEQAFINVVITASASGEFKWAKYFMQKYVGFMAIDLREDALKLSNASLNFHKKFYNKVLKLLATIQRKDLSMTIRVRSLRIRTYYEISLKDPTYDDMAWNEINNMQAFIRNNKNKIPDKVEEAYLNFCKICTAILKGKSRAELQKMMDKLKRLKFRIWLQEKVEALR